ncbi:MAG: GDP-mannose dehydrogenase [Candidatus Bathyarchaeota archaeon]|nr:GDP-mannose dehydrogenase [Candidatus Bathyarchaeota archaeon]
MGLGEIGATLFTLLKEQKESFTVYGLDVDEAKMRAVHQEESKLPSEVDAMHICLPCKTQSTFTDVVYSYVKRFKPKLVIINSTVPPGTTMKIQERCRCLVAHSPVRGVHRTPEHMKWEMKRWTKYVGGTTQESANAACRHFEKMNLKVKKLKSCTETELAKLFETTYRAWMIACFQEMHRISRAAKADFDDAVDFLADTHRVRLDRPIMFPGIIGGHCLIPNTELLLNYYDSEFLRLILKSNEKRKEELKDKTIEKEVEKVAEKAKTLEKELAELLNKCNPDMMAETAESATSC